jgi:hypothetical protein
MQPISTDLVECVEDGVELGTRDAAAGVNDLQLQVEGVLII